MKTISKPYFLFCIALSNESVAASTVLLKAARINDTLTEPSSAVSILPGDFIEWDAFVFGWKSDFEFLSAIQLTLDSVGLVSGTTGTLRPIYYEGPIPLFNLCASEADCIPNARCTDIGCAPPPCPPSGCPGDQLCSSLDWCFRHTDYPAEGSREVGLFVELDRQDFVFYSLQPLVITSISRSPALRWGALPFAVRGIPDPGVPRYAGTVILKASELGSNDGQACGMFSVGFIDDIDFSFFTGLASGYWGFFSSIAPDFIPLAVHVDCSGGMLPLSECNRDGLVTLAEHRHLTECLDGTALEGTCFCFDNNDDGQVDMRDFADLQNFFDGP